MVGTITPWGVEWKTPNGWESAAFRTEAVALREAAKISKRANVISVVIVHPNGHHSLYQGT